VNEKTKLIDKLGKLFERGLSALWHAITFIFIKKDNIISPNNKKNESLPYTFHPGTGAIPPPRPFNGRSRK